MRTTSISPEQANALGLSAQHSEAQIRWALDALSRGETANARERLRDAQARCESIHKACCFGDPPADGESICPPLKHFGRESCGCLDQPKLPKEP